MSLRSKSLLSNARLPSRATLAVATCLAAVSAVQPAFAGAEPWVETLVGRAITDNSVPKCEEGIVLDTIRSKFGTADAAILHRGLAIATVDRIHQAYEGQNDPSPVYRRYCEARAELNDGKHTALYYLVEQDAGFVGVTWNVEYCMIGLEPWRVHDGRCHTVRHRWW
ncbi:MAG: hypothetical protein P4L82_18160 [Ancalomicrobiaceae bacterium]|nr:hypothetical protein [Ancalomicrobiaceae bacterium]